MLGRVRLLTLMLVQNKAQCDLEKETAEMMIQCTIRENTVNVDSHIQEMDAPRNWQNTPSIGDSWARGICHMDTEWKCETLCPWVTERS